MRFYLLLLGTLFAALGALTVLASLKMRGLIDVPFLSPTNPVAAEFDLWIAGSLIICAFVLILLGRREA